MLTTAPALSLQGVFPLLSGDSEAIVCTALQAINDNIAALFYEVAQHVTTLEALASGGHGKVSMVASLVLAKLFFYLQEPQRSIPHILNSGEMFHPALDDSLFGQTMTTALIDHYLLTRDPQIVPMVDGLVKQSLAQKDPESALALAMESRRMDLLDVIIGQGSLELLSFALELCEDLVSEEADFKTTILNRICQRQLGLRPVDMRILTACGNASSVLDSPAVQADQKQQFLLQQKSDILRHCRLLFSSHRNHTDPLLLERIKSALNPSFSLHHQALTATHGLMQCGTTCDDFIRGDLPWFGLATNWAKFSGVASMGVVHHGQRDPLKLFDAFLPKGSVVTSEYSEAGSLMALGLVGRYEEAFKSKLSPEEDFSKNESEVEQLLMKSLSHTSEVIQHGACMGLGLWLLGRGTPEHIDAVKSVLYADSTTSGEGAAYSLGLLAYGRHAEFTGLLEELCEYAKETQHEKISRALAVAFSLMYSESCVLDDFVERLLGDEGEPIRRYAGAYCVVGAFANSGSPLALSRLLRLAVTDTNDDVRRIATAGLGFVVGESHRESLFDLLPVLLQSHNPHIRYGAAMALGVAFAGSGNEAACDLVKPLSRDLIDFVRQSALQALALILQQQSEAKSKDLRKALETTIGNKYEDALVKFGAIQAQGLLDAGGRNCVFTLRSGTQVGGGKNPIAGGLLFLHSWFWYPLVHCLALSLVPTAFIGVTSETFDAYPMLKGMLRTPPSQVAYPVPLKPQEAAVAKKPVASAVLSANKRRRGEEAAVAMDIDEQKEAGKEEAETAKDESKKEEPEPAFTLMENFERVPLWAAKHFTLPRIPDSDFDTSQWFDCMQVHWLPPMFPNQPDYAQEMLVFAKEVDHDSLPMPNSMVVDENGKNGDAFNVSKPAPQSFQFDDQDA